MPAWTQAEYDALKAAVALGVQKVGYADGKIVVYDSRQEMRSLLAEMERSLGITTEPRFTLASHSRE